MRLYDSASLFIQIINSLFIFSMGGSVAVHVAARKAFRNLHGLVVVDVVEVSNIFRLVLKLWLNMK
jgi:hypothetical protein